MTARRQRQAATDKPGRVLLYIRVSALMGRGGDDFHSPDIQVDAILGGVGRGLREVLPPSGERVMDIDVSGRTFEREGLDTVLQMARDKQIDLVAVADLSRLGRNLRESLNFMAELRDLGVGVVSAREHIDDSPQGRFIAAQFLGLAELLSDQIGDYWAATAQRRAIAGHHNGIPPRGYRRVGVKTLDDGRTRATGPLVVDPAVAPAVTRAFERHAAGDRLADIIRDYREQTGQHMAMKELKRTLRNRTYLGRVILLGQEYDGVHEPLVTQDVWDLCQRRLGRDRQIPPRTLHVVHALAGLIVCDRCGIAMTHRRLGQTARDRGPFYLHRPLAMGAGVGPDGEVCLGGGSPRVSHVEDEVIRQVAARIARLRTDTAARAARVARGARRAAELPRLAFEATAAREALGRLTVQLARNLITEDAYKLAAEELQGDVDRLTRQADEVRATPAPAEPSREVAQLAERLAVLWPKMTAPERQQALRTCEVRQVRLVPATRRRQPLEGRVRVLFEGDEDAASGSDDEVLTF